MHLHPSMPTADRAQLDDATLLDRYRAADDREALGLLFTRHVHAAYRLARRYSGSAADAEDAVQAALLRVMRQAAQFRGGSTVKAWLLGAVVSECHNRARADLRRTTREAAVARAEAFFDQSADDPALQPAVLAAIQELPQHYRAPVWMHYCEGLSSSDVATALNLSANTVRRQLARGVDRLRSSLGVSGRAMTLAAITATLASLPVETAPASLGSAVLSLAAGGAPLTAAAAGTAAKASFVGKAALSSKITAAVLTVAAATAGTVYVAQPAGQPSPAVQAVAEISPGGGDRITGWRGNWTGRFPDTDPPLTWERRIKSPLKDLRYQAKKPKGGDEATADHLLWTGRIRDWLILGPMPAKSLDDAPLPGEATVQPDDGQAVAGSAWKPFLGFKALGTGSGQVVYLHTYLHAEQASKANLWHLGHSKGVRIWNNGKVVYSGAERNGFRGHVTIDLVKGWNRFLVKLLHEDANTGIDLHLVPIPPYSYEAKNFAWMTALPGPSNAQPIVVGDSVLITAEPYYLLCFDKKTGKVLWIRSNSWYDANKADLVKKGDPKVKALEDANGKLQAVLGALVKQMNAGISASGAPSNRPILNPATLAEKQKAEQALAALVKDADAGFDKKMTESWEQTGSGGGWSVATPCSDGKRVYAWFEHGVAVCCELDGQTVWTRFVSFPGNVHHGFAGSPVLVGGKFIVEQREVYAFDAASGEQVWKDKARFASWGSLVPAKLGSEDIVFTSGGEPLKVADGKSVWPFRLNNPGTTTSVVENGVLYGFANGELVAYALPKTTKAAAPKLLYRADASFPLRAGSSPVSNGVTGSLLVHDGLIYILSMGGYLKCFDAKTGKQLYMKELPLQPYVGYADAPGCAISPTLAGGKYIYVFDNHGGCVIFEAGREFKQVALNVLENRTGVGAYGEYQEQIWATPVFVGKHMFLRGPEYLYCIGEP